MKKIIAALDVLYFSEEQVETFKYIAKETQSPLTILCLDNIISELMPMGSVDPEGYAYSYEQISAEKKAAMEARRDNNLKWLHTICDSGNTEIELKDTAGIAAIKIIEESRFADLLLINNSTSFATLYDTNPPRFVKDLLADAECPVMVLPDKITPIREIIFSYNGTFSSMYAIKQFTQLFPGYADMPVKVVYVAEKKERSIPWASKLREYLDRHYDAVEYITLEGEPATEFLAMLIHRKDCLITYGAYGRSGVSRFFRRSHADNILRTVNIPVFITHP
ncbi:universal stress protein family protein [Chitinophaga polysaccharea]|uniref:Universal stress protein family protein n=1 Tax=Chitinophaga polysaccharea TaxID=1293035 RepID=A0A561PA67_9BACT|nr:universal stress protein [Chitinophaga polysaccharea]TWF34960.1 universal stress protein family protein [Chitinophaga polysaccharea]